MKVGEIKIKYENGGRRQKMKCEVTTVYSPDESVTF
jgi:hypothetical protein